MKLEELAGLWNAVPGEMRLILGAFIGATIRTIRKEKTNVTGGLISALTGFIAGFMLAYGSCVLMKWDIKEMWFMAGLFGFMANYALGGLETVGKQLESNPIKFLADNLTEFIQEIWLKIKPPKA